MLLAHREALHQRIWVHAQAELLRQRTQLGARGAAGRGRGPQAFGAHQHVVQYREVACQREVLVHQADTCCNCGALRAWRKRLAKYINMPAVCHIVAKEDADQRRFASAVFAEQTQNLALR